MYPLAGAAGNSTRGAMPEPGTGDVSVGTSSVASHAASKPAVVTAIPSERRANQNELNRANAACVPFSLCVRLDFRGLQFVCHSVKTGARPGIPVQSGPGV
jgi:hypothetical protein